LDDDYALSASTLCYLPDLLGNCLIEIRTYILNVNAPTDRLIAAALVVRKMLE
jgi:hypothetical protein